MQFAAIGERRRRELPGAVRGGGLAHAAGAAHDAAAEAHGGEDTRLASAGGPVRQCGRAARPPRRRRQLPRDPPTTVRRERAESLSAERTRTSVNSDHLHMLV